MSIGFFKFDAVPSVDKPLVLAHATLNENIKGYFYVRDSDCKDISTVDKGSEFFGVLDDSSGFGACLFIKDLDVESDALLLQNNLHVKGNATIDGDETVKGNSTIDGNETVKGNSEVKGNQTVTGNGSINGKLDVIGNIKTSAMITGNSPNTTINLTAAHAALILAAGMSGTAAPLPSVPVIMSNG